MRRVHVIAFSLPMLALAGLLLALGALAARQTWHVFASYSPGGAFSGHRIVIDPGHGGPDPGSTGHGVVEKEVVLAIGRRLASYIRDAGGTATLTREGDADLSGLSSGSLARRKRLDLAARVKRAEEAGADLLLSVHANAIGSSRWHGAQTFYRPDRNPANRRLAETLQDELVALTGRTNRVASRDIHQYILDQLSIPAATVEVGFLSNPEEAQLLATPGYQQKVAWALFVGLARFLLETEHAPPGMTTAG